MARFLAFHATFPISFSFSGSTWQPRATASASRRALYPDSSVLLLIHARTAARKAAWSGRPSAFAPCWLQIPSAREASGANLVKRHAGSRDESHRVRGLRGPTPLSREVVESAAGDRGPGADALRCKSGRTR